MNFIEYLSLFCTPLTHKPHSKRNFGLVAFLSDFNSPSIHVRKSLLRLNKPLHELIDGVIDIFRGNAELPAGFFNFRDPV